MTLMDHQFNWWWYSGKYFGYPECCIRAFCKFEHLGLPARKFNGTGFVPCAKCEAEKTEKQLLDEINKNRVATTPFPADRYPARSVIEKWAVEQEQARDPRYLKPAKASL